MSSSRLQISRLTALSELDGFRCGINEIDEIISNELPDILRRGIPTIYIVRMEEVDTPVAVFALRQGDLMLDTIDINEAHGDYSDVDESEVRYEHYPSIELELLAVHQDFRDKHIGKTIIDVICTRQESFGFHNNMFIMVDAYFEVGYTAVPFYERVGFLVTGQKHTTDTVRMFKIIE